MTELDETRWKEAYPKLAEASRHRSELTPDVRLELAPDLSDGEFEAGARSTSRYLQRLANASRDLIYEEYFLALSLAAQACVINALAPAAIEAERAGIESNLRKIVSRFKSLLDEDLARAHAPHRARWPFPQLLDE